MGGSSWIGADDWHGGEPEHVPALPAAPRGRRTVVVVSCVACDGVDVFKRDWKAGDAVAVWQCRECQARWKEPMSVGGGGKATLA